MTDFSSRDNNSRASSVLESSVIFRSRIAASRAFFTETLGTCVRDLRHLERAKSRFPNQSYQGLNAPDEPHYASRKPTLSGSVLSITSWEIPVM